jgi:hypothetical protein
LFHLLLFHLPVCLLFFNLFSLLFGDKDKFELCVREIVGIRLSPITSFVIDDRKWGRPRRNCLPERLT